MRSVFSQDHRHLVQFGSRPNLGIPNRELMVYDATASFENHHWGDCEHPKYCREPLHLGKRLGAGQALGQPTCCHSKEFGQALHAEDSAAASPQSVQDLYRSILLRLVSGIVCVNQHVGVKE